MPKRTAYSWPYIKQIYIAGKRDPEALGTVDYTYTEIAAMFNVKSIGSVKKHADKEGWDIEREKIKKKDEEKLRLHLEQLKSADIPNLVTIRERGLKFALGTVTTYLRQLDEGLIEVKPNEALKAFEFLISEYHTLFGVPQPKVETEDKAVELKVGNIDDLYDLAKNIRRR